MENHRNKVASAMIVEDEKDLCYLLECILKKQNLHTSCANSLTEATNIINRVEPDILFLDNHLPDGSGTDFIGKVKKLYPLTKIIMITAHDSPLDIERAFDKGADYFISKPFNTLTVQNMLSRLSLAIAV